MSELSDPEATERLGVRIGRALQTLGSGLVVALAGELGAGKTALTRAVLRAQGHDGVVVSPSYTLVERYPLGTRNFYHLDLYRIADPEELEFLGVREIDGGNDWVFIEWAERGQGFLPALDVTITLSYAGAGRRAHWMGHGRRGREFVTELERSG